MIFDTVKKINQGLRTRDIDFETVDKLRKSVEKMLIILGITVENPVVTEEDRKLFAAWNDAKAARDFAAADEARRQLMDRGLL